MFRWLALCLVLCAGAFALVALATGVFHLNGATAAAVEPLPDGPLPDVLDAVTAAAANGPGRGGDIVLPGARLTPIERQEVPSQRDGTILVVGTDEPADKAHPGEALAAIRVPLLAMLVDSKDANDPDRPKEAKDFPPESEWLFLVAAKGSKFKEAVGQARLGDQWEAYKKSSAPLYRRWHEGDPLQPRKVETAFEQKVFYKLKEGDWVNKDQLLALVDTTVQVNDVSSKVAKLETAEADYQASVKTAGEATRRAMESQRLWDKGANFISEDTYRADLLNRDRYIEEAKSKDASRKVSGEELSASLTILRLHEVRASIPGVIKAIYKHPGESVKNLDPVVQVQNPLKMRVEGQAGLQDAQGLAINMTANVEPNRPVRPIALLPGHQAEVTCVAVSRADMSGKQMIVSGGEDGRVRFWTDWTSKQPQVFDLDLHAGVLAAACTAPTAAANLALVGDRNGVGRIINLDNLSAQPIKLAERHKGPITCVAFSPDGTICATGGEDRTIRLWNVADGKPIHTLNAAHKAAVTSLEFAAPRARELVVSVGGKYRSFIVPGNVPVTIGDKDDSIDNVRKDAAATVTLTDDRVSRVQIDPPAPVAPAGKDVVVTGTVVRLWKGQPLRLVSAGGDNTLGVWSLDGIETKAPVRTALPANRSGDVAKLGVSADGRYVLFDRGSDLRVLSLDDLEIEGVIQSSEAGAHFSTTALFSPDGDTVLTNSASDGRLQLWRTPVRLGADDQGRGAELRQFVWAGGPATCAAIDPTAKPGFAVTGMRDGFVLVWAMPKSEDVLAPPLAARLSLVEKALDSGARQVRVWADLKEMSKDEWLKSDLTPGGSATIVVPAPGN